MKKTICGVDCGVCPMNAACAGCAETGGKPFGKPCVTAERLKKGDLCAFRQRLLKAVNALNIPDLDEVKELYALKGSFVNLELPLPGGQTAKFWDDDRVYLGNQLPKRGTQRCYGLAADETYLMICEYGENGADARLVAFVMWNRQEEPQCLKPSSQLAI